METTSQKLPVIFVIAKDAKRYSEYLTSLKRINADVFNRYQFDRICTKEDLRKTNPVKVVILTDAHLLRGYDDILESLQTLSRNDKHVLVQYLDRDHKVLQDKYSNEF